MLGRGAQVDGAVLGKDKGLSESSWSLTGPDDFGDGEMRVGRSRRGKDESNGDEDGWGGSVVGEFEQVKGGGGVGRREGRVGGSERDEREGWSFEIDEGLKGCGWMRVLWKEKENDV